jgi:hypothetical protein
VVLQDHAPWAELYPRRLGFAERERAYGASAVSETRLTDGLIVAVLH